MKDTDIDLTRRKVLGALGSIGVASVGSGMGSTAFLSDQERYPDNQLVAGELDLKVDWQEYYSDWSEDEEAAAPGVRMVESADEVTDGEVPLPYPTDPLIAVPDSQFDAFWAQTKVEAYPDEDGDGRQDETYTLAEIRADPSLVGLDAGASDSMLRAAYEDQYADVPDDLDRALLEVDDLKPGDFGGVTFSLHLLGNPGYCWLNGRLREDAENGVNEPEADATDEDGTQAEPDTDGELAERLQVAVFYDDGDGVREATETVGGIDVVGADAELLTGNLREVLTTLRAGVGVPLDADPTDEERDCHDPGTTYYLTMLWWLPAEEGNEIQTDSVSFDLGFYTEQCRHNDGSGPVRDLGTGRADWQVTSAPDGSGLDLPVAAQTVDPSGAWATPDCAEWVDPFGTGALETDPPGEYVYELDFEVVPGPADDTLVVDLYGADSAVALSLDGDLLVSAEANAFGDLDTLPAVDPVQGLDEGTHTLTAAVTNEAGSSGNPTGVLVCARLE